MREFWEAPLLHELSQTSWSSSLVFKGGTALRLAYRSPRFSDDLDFSSLGRVGASEVFHWAVVTAKKLNNLSGSDLKTGCILSEKLHSGFGSAYEIGIKTTRHRMHIGMSDGHNKGVTPELVAYQGRGGVTVSTKSQVRTLQR